MGEIILPQTSSKISLNIYLLVNGTPHADKFLFPSILGSFPSTLGQVHLDMDRKDL